MTTKPSRRQFFADKFTQVFLPNKLSQCTAAPAPASKMVPTQPQRLGRTGVAAGRPARPPVRPLRLLPHSHLLRQLGRGGGDTTAPLGAAGRGGEGGGGPGKNVTDSFPGQDSLLYILLVFEPARRVGCGSQIKNCAWGGIWGGGGSSRGSGRAIHLSTLYENETFFDCDQHLFLKNSFQRWPQIFCIIRF